MAMAAAGATSTTFPPQIQSRRRGNRCRSREFRTPQAHWSSDTKRKAMSSPDYYGYDLYKLLGVDDGAKQPEIKKSYRWLQKRCHPDIAGELGHDMSILLNQAYDILSDPNTRSSYDAMRSEWIPHEDFTGEPLYSKWMGPASEQSAVFVDEVRCTGCLSCALIAPNTFAVEKKFGRARAVSQWGDSKPVIDDAIRSCPVDCISWVNRRQLAALEYLMSKHSRSTINIDASSRRGADDVFNSVDRFLKKNAQYELRKRSRAPAVDAIQARAGRWWHFFVGKSYSSPDSIQQSKSSTGAIVKGSHQAGAFGPSLFADSKLRALYEAVTQRRNSHQSEDDDEEDYWVPLKHVDPLNSVSSLSSTTAPPSSTSRIPEDQELGEQPTPDKSRVEELLLRRIPAAASVAAALYVGLAGSSEAQELPATGAFAVLMRHSPLLHQLVDSGVMQPLQAGVTWYILSSLACGVAAITLRRIDRSKM